MSSNTSEVATFGGGCFWCLDPVFRDLRGVLHVTAGYAGGTMLNPTYQQVCNGNTGHAEVVQIEFDPAVIDFRTLVEVFFAIHDPTTLNRQGADHGTQYRSVIYYHDPEQERIAREVIAELAAEKVFARPIVTEVTALPNWFPAEDYHQDYYANHPEAGYCMAVIAPKLAKFRAKFASLRQA